MNKLADTKWKVRPVLAEGCEEQWRTLYASGQPTKTDGSRAKTRVPKGLAKAGATDTIYICWKGNKQPAFEKFWQVLKGSQSITSGLIKDVPVIAPGRVPRVEAATRQSVLVESIVAAPAEARSSDTESEEQQEDRVKRKYTKRRRTMRRTGTDTSRVLLFANAPAPEFVKALVQTLKAGWIFSGTPEAGVGISAGIETGVQTLAMCKNQAHSETLSVLVREQLQGLLVDGASELCNAGFATRLAAVKEAESSSSAASTESESDSDAEAGKKKKKKEEEKSEDDKEKKAPEPPEPPEKKKRERKKRETKTTEENSPKKKKENKVSSADVVALLSPNAKKAKKAKADPTVG
jgi:hypothetical protein